MTPTSPPSPETAARQRWMSVLARASAEDIGRHLADAPPLPAHRRLRGPETGLVMVRGRAGGDGAPFNLGEMTVSRCTVRLDGAGIGHAHVAGRDHAQAELAAVLDALMQDAAWQAMLERLVITPLEAMQAERRAATARRAAATKVEFFTMTQMR